MVRNARRHHMSTIQPSSILVTVDPQHLLYLSVLRSPSHGIIFSRLSNEVQNCAMKATEELGWTSRRTRAANGRLDYSTGLRTQTLPQTHQAEQDTFTGKTRDAESIPPVVAGGGGGSSTFHDQRRRRCAALHCAQLGVICIYQYPLPGWQRRESTRKALRRRRGRWLRSVVKCPASCGRAN